MPGAASLACTHRSKIKNIRLSTLRDTRSNTDPRVAILDFEKYSIAYDKSMKDKTEGRVIAIKKLTYLCNIGKHMDCYEKLGHPYVS
jgi:translation initiation factor IF-3